MHDNTNSEVRDAVLLAGGFALVVFGAGLMLAHPAIRRTLLGALLRSVRSAAASAGSCRTSSVISS